MERMEAEYATGRLAQLRGEYKVDILADWGFETPDGQGEWRTGNWIKAELDRLHDSIGLVAGVMGGAARFIENLGGVTVRKADIGTHGGEAHAHQVSLSTRGTFSAWTVVHELAHAWDANQGWRLARLLERYTGGYTSPVRSFVIKLLRQADAGLWQSENKPGRQGRKPGCNAAGYFYGDKPSGSNWKFNRVEDFAESVAMYVGWGRDNALSDWAEARVKRYLLPNGANDNNFGVDNWSDYAVYFYPENGDYTKTKRWQFVDDLVNGRISVA